MIIPFDEANRIVQQWRTWHGLLRLLPRSWYRDLVYEIAASLAKQNHRIIALEDAQRGTWTFTS